MNEDYNRVYQFKIKLKHIKPEIWRVIQVPESYTFWDLHVAIQDAMGWQDCRLHEFILTNPTSGEKKKIGIPTEESINDKTLPGWKEFISMYFNKKNKNAVYIYDFGDNWQHIITLEGIIPVDENNFYPRCIAGERACPMEDCDSMPGYEDILEILENPEDGEYESTIISLGDKYDPEYFNPETVFFDDPEERFKETFEVE